MKTGILGGTFDPVHNGHLAIAEEAKKQLALTGVLFLPAGQPWMKSNQPISPAQHRTEMIRLAITGRPYCKLSTIEIEHRGPSYSADTVAQLKALAGGASELYFILGWDSLAQLPYWKEPSRLIEMCFLVAVSRPGYTQPDIGELETKIPGLSQRVIFLNKPRVDISATDIRERVARGLSISRLVPQTVEKYIKENHLYMSFPT
ncbi:MAG: nicotinate-nucleotide adenylyltransferase [Dehalococcoidales bacterium]|nr:nicotinate-nucleotide adenylyltransferase [Dehalococcoidales bacterium]